MVSRSHDNRWNRVPVHPNRCDATRSILGAEHLYFDKGIQRGLVAHVGRSWQLLGRDDLHGEPHLVTWQFDPVFEIAMFGPSFAEIFRL